MRNPSLELEISSAVENDPRWELVERIVASPSFVRSPRLCSLLMHLCEVALLGRSDEINEQSIGEALFERAPNYAPSIDGIVRSHASRLRQRLAQYFSEEGEHETIRLTIPKGGYTPHFPRHSAPVLPSDSTVAPLSPASAPADQPPEARATPDISNRYRHLFWSTGVAFVAACVVIFALLSRSHLTQPVEAARHPLWNTLFRPDQTTLIVASDTGLTALQTLTNS